MKIKMEDLTLREKVGQLLMVKASGLIQRYENGKVVDNTNAEIAEILKNRPFGSIWAHGYVKMQNVNLAEEISSNSAPMAEHKKWIDSLNQSLRVPLLAGMDCENGTTSFSDGFKTVSGFSIGAANDEQATFDLCAGIAREMRIAGGNWRWSPVVDIHGRFSAGLGRGYSTDPEKLHRLSLAALKGMESEGVAGTIKHFPGADPYNFRDSHFVTTYNTLTLEEWEEGPGNVFKRLIDAGTPTIMLSHGAFPAVDDTMINGRYLPTTCSKKIVDGLLRKKLGFEGVVITDAMEMTGLRAFGSFEEICIMAINAGADVLLGLLPDEFDPIYNAVLDGRISMERINESCARVLALKEKLGLFNEEEREIDFESARARTIAANTKIAEKSITLLRDRNQMLPVKKENIKKVGIMCTSHAPSTIKELEVMKAEFEKRGAEVELWDSKGLKYGSLKQQIDDKDLVIYAGFVAMHQPLGMPCLFHDELRPYHFAFSYGKEKILGLSMGYPYLHFDSMEGADTFVNIYSPSANSQKAFVRAVYGEIPFTTESPCDIEPKRRVVYC